MSSLNTTLGIALSSLQTAQLGLSTTSHNMANTNTTGYSRQELVQQSIIMNNAGSGVKLTAIRQVADRYAQESVVRQTSALGYAQTTYNMMENIEVIFGTPGSDTSVEKTINSFFSQLSQLASSPESSAQKLNVVKAASLVVDNISSIQGQLIETQRNADQQIDNEIMSLNNALKNISQLNEQIAKINATGINGENANDLLDQRQVYVNFVAERLDLQTNYDAYGRITLQTLDGRRLVDSGYTQLERIPPAAGQTYGAIGIRPMLSSGQPSATVYPLNTDVMTGGSFKALVDIRDTDIPDLMAQMDEFAATFISAFNSLHSQGSAVPPPRTLTTGNGYQIPSAGADLFAAPPAGAGYTPGAVFDLSIVQAADGSPISTTVGGTSITLPAAGPFTLADLANLINTNPNVGGDVTATVITDSSGNPALQIQANNANHGVVLNNVSGNALGELGTNNFFTGTGASTMAIRSDILSNPSLVATAQMRSSDGGLSLLDNQNAVKLAQMAESTFIFDAAGSLASQNTSIASYFITISSTFAVNISDKADRLEFQQNLYDDVNERNVNISGVNMDEELSMLLVYQNAYQSSARIISVVDELYKTLIDML